MEHGVGEPIPQDDDDASQDHAEDMDPATHDEGGAMGEQGEEEAAEDDAVCEDPGKEPLDTEGGYGEGGEKEIQDQDEIIPEKGEEVKNDLTNGGGENLETPSKFRRVRSKSSVFDHGNDRQFVDSDEKRYWRSIRGHDDDDNDCLLVSEPAASSSLRSKREKLKKLMAEISAAKMPRAVCIMLGELFSVYNFMRKLKVACSRRSVLST